MSLPPQAPPHYYDEYLISMSINDSYKKYTNDSSVTRLKKRLDKVFNMV